MASEFKISHWEGVLANSAAVKQTNLVTNGDFETNDFTGWTNHTNWSIIGAQSLTPNGYDYEMAQAKSAATVSISILESARINVTAGVRYNFRMALAAPNTYVAGRTAKPTPNYMLVLLRWWNVASGGTPIKTTIVYKTVVPSSPTMGMLPFGVTAPAGAIRVSIYIQNTHSGGGTGTPAGAVIDNIFFASSIVGAMPLIEVLNHISISYYQSFDKLTYSTDAQQGFKRCTFVLHGPTDYLWWWMLNAIGDHIQIAYGNKTVFEGMVWIMDAMLRGKRYSVTYDEIANYILVKYDAGYGQKGTGGVYRAFDNDSMAHYGRKDLQDSGNAFGRDGARMRAQLLLATHKVPRPMPLADVGGGGGEEEDTIAVTAYGYWATLSFIKDASVAYYGKGNADTSAQIATATSSILNKLRNLTPNDWISTDYSNVQTTGLLLPMPKPDSVKDKSAQEMISDLLKMGTSNQRAIVSGIMENRMFTMNERPTTFGYATDERDTKTRYYDAGMETVERAKMQAGQYLKFVRPLPTWTTYADIDLDPSAKFLKEVEYDTETGELKFVTPADEPMDLTLSYLVRRHRPHV